MNGGTWWKELGPVLLMSQMTVKKSDVTHGNWTTLFYGAMTLGMLICNLILENLLE